MELMDVKKLVPHKRNTYFFDDIDGEPWVAFCESIETSGIIEPIIVTQDLVIVSGHQRVRAAKQLGIKQVAVEMRNYDSEDEILKQLIETNIRQRGLGNTNSVKLMRCERELERIYGVQRGNNQHERTGTKFPSKTQEQLAEEAGMSVKHWRNIKNIERLAPEVQDMIERGQVTESAVRGLYKVLSPEQQRAFAKEFADKDRVTGREVEFYKKRIQELSNENKELRDREPEVVTKEVEVVPDDYDSLKRSVESYKGDNKRLMKERQQYLDERNEANKRIKELEEREGIHEAQAKLERESEYLEVRINSFIRDMGGYVWITDKVEELPESQREKVIRAIKNVNAWSQQMILNLGGNIL